MLRKARNAEEFHGASGLGDAVLPEPKMRSDPRNAVQMIHGKADELGRDLTIVAIGPLTNVAAALLSDPTLPEKVGGLVLMGGAFNFTSYGFGNANAVAEFNIWHDPEAARIVFNSGIHLVCAGLDVTTNPDNRMSVAMFQEIKAKDTVRSRLIADLCGSLVKRFKGFSLHDPMAVAYAVDPTIFRTGKYRVDVETMGELTRGMTVVDRRHNRMGLDEANAEVIVEADAKRFHRLIMERVAEGQ
jgi:inosine-uridine nucleoside N-ribohydrolase